MEFIFGGTGSGKSEFAEHRACRYNGHKIYLATMEYSEKGAWEKIDRHRKMREGKGFQTIELSRDIERLTNQTLVSMPSLTGGTCHSVEFGYQIGESVILLECLGTLLANEMFMAVKLNWNLLEQGGDLEQELRTMVTPLVDKIFNALVALDDSCYDLIVVSSDVFGELGDYSLDVKAYLMALGMLHRRIGGMCREAWEVVYTVPIRWE